LLTRLEQKDYIIGKLAELGEAKARLETLEVRHNETMERLVNEMTRAFNAESRIVEIEPIIGEVVRLRSEIAMLRQSRSFRFGRKLTAPVRVLRRALK